jgi:hypothetical protein
MAPAPSLGWKPIGPSDSRHRGCGAPLYNTRRRRADVVRAGTEGVHRHRQDPYPIDLLRANHQLELDGNYAATFDKYGIQCAVVPPTSPTAQVLDKDPAWSLKYADDRWSVRTRTR